VPFVYLLNSLSELVGSFSYWGHRSVIYVWQLIEFVNHFLCDEDYFRLFFFFFFDWLLSILPLRLNAAMALAADSSSMGSDFSSFTDTSG